MSILDGYRKMPPVVSRILKFLNFLLYCLSLSFSWFKNGLLTLGPYKSALVAAPGATAARRVNLKIGKIYYIKCKS